MSQDQRGQVGREEEKRTSPDDEHLFRGHGQFTEPR